MKKIEVKITFTEELLGTASGNQELHADFIFFLQEDSHLLGGR